MNIVSDRDSVKSVCRLLAYVYLCLGTIGSIALAYTLGNKIDVSYSGRTYYERDWGITWGVFLGSLLSVFIICAILFALASIIESFEGIEYKLYSLELKVDSLEEKMIKEIAIQGKVNDETSEDFIAQLPCIFRLSLFFLFVRRIDSSFYNLSCNSSLHS